MAMKSSRVQPRNGSTSRSDGKVNHNGILLGLSRSESDSVFEKLEWVNLPTHTVLHEAGQPIEFGYFINGGLASILTVMANGKSVEVGLSGKEGFIGASLVTGYKN